MTGLGKSARMAALSLCIATPCKGSASCDGLLPLVQIHDAYRAMISAPVDQKTDAASLLTRTIPMFSATHFTQSFQALGLDTDEDRLNTLLLDGYLLAGRMASSPVFVQNQTHEANLNWLMSQITRTGCFTALKQASGTGDRFDLGAPPSLSSTPISSPRRSTTTFARTFDWSIILWVIAAISVLGLVALVLRSRPVRIARVERLPRENVALLAKARHQGKEETIVVLDISLGGAKIEWEKPPEQGEHVEIDLPCGPRTASIIWSNAYFAGLMFDAHLSAEEYDTTIAANGSMTRSQLTNVF